MNSIKALLALNTLSSLSLWVDFFLLFLVPVHVWNASSSDIALLAFSLGAASLFLGPVVGIVLDRIHIKVSLLSGMALRILTTAGLYLAPSFEWFLIMAALKGLANTLYFPTLTIAIRQLIAADARTAFFSYSSLLDQLTKVTTPLLAGALTLWLPTQSIFLISAVLLLVALPLLISLWPGLQAARPNTALTIKAVISDLRDGLKIFRAWTCS